MRNIWKISGAFIALLAVYIAFTLRDSFDAESMRGKRVIVTGASRGIGEQVAYQYARLGANILITARRENILKQVTAKCMELGAQSAHYLSVDMEITDETGILITEVEKKLGGLDYLILVHGNFFWDLWDGDMNRLREMMNINFVSYVNLATKALPLLSKSGGSILAVSSVAGVVSLPGMVTYSAADHAVVGFFEGFRHELRFKGIDVSVTIFSPGNIATDTFIRFTEQMDSGNFFIDLAAKPEHVAMAIVKSAAARLTTACYPWYDIRPIEIIHTISPDLSDWCLSFLYQFLEKTDREFPNHAYNL